MATILHFAEILILDNSIFLLCRPPLRAQEGSVRNSHLHYDHFLFIMPPTFQQGDDALKASWTRTTLYDNVYGQYKLFIYFLVLYLSSAPGDTWWTDTRKISLVGSALTSFGGSFLPASVLFQIRSSAPNTKSKSETSETSNQNCLSSANCFSLSENLCPAMKIWQSGCN